MQAIDSFMGDYRFLSNYHMCEIEYEGLKYPSTEHAYQAAKSPYDLMRETFAHEIPTPKEAKKVGKNVILRPDWEDVKLQVMEDIVRYKFTHHEDLKQALIQTYPNILIEGNYWHDTFWGVCNGVGENNLGKILMKIRDELIDG